MNRHQLTSLITIKDYPEMAVLTISLIQKAYLDQEQMNSIMADI